MWPTISTESTKASSRSEILGKTRTDLGEDDSSRRFLGPAHLYPDPLHGSCVRRLGEQHPERYRELFGRTLEETDEDNRQRERKREQEEVGESYRQVHDALKEPGSSRAEDQKGDEARPASTSSNRIWFESILRQDDRQFERTVNTVLIILLLIVALIVLSQNERRPEEAPCGPAPVSDVACP